MPTFKSFSRLERVYSHLETTFGTAAAVTGTDANRVIKLGIGNDVNLLIRRDKTGTRTGVLGARGRVSSKWSFEASLVGSGTPGTAPPHDNYYQLIFGQAPTGAAYTLSDAILSASIYSYRQPSTIEQRVAIGSICQNFEFTLGQDVATFRLDGECMNALTTATFATADATAKGGIVSFPAEPGSPTYTDGGLIAGFTGAITIDSGTIVNIRQCTIKGSTGNALPHDIFNSYYGGAPEGDERQFTFSFNAYDDDEASLVALKAAADQKTPVNATVQIGTVAGSICTFTVTGIQLASPTYNDDQRAYITTFPDSPFKGSNPTALDELAMTWT
jgi:hypothetical protein